MRGEPTDQARLRDDFQANCDFPDCEGDPIFYAVQGDFVRLRGCAQHYAPVVLLAARDHELYLRELMGDRFEYLRVPTDVVAQWRGIAFGSAGDN